MNWKQSFADETMIRCPENTQQADRGTITHMCDSNKAATIQRYWYYTSDKCSPASSPHISQNTPKTDHIQGVASNTFKTHSECCFGYYS